MIKEKWIHSFISLKMIDIIYNLCQNGAEEHKNSPPIRVLDNSALFKIDEMLNSGQS